MPDELSFDRDLDRRLRSALEAAAAPVDGAGVTASVARRVVRHRRRVRTARTATMAVVALIVLGGIAVAGRSSIEGTRRSDRASTRVPAPVAVAPALVPGAPSHSAEFGPMDGPFSPFALPPTAGPTYGPAIASCPTGVGSPSITSGRYCGPRPPAGNGLGPDGECTGRETGPPCGPGVIPGKYYAYTMPGSCSGLIIFDGRRWVSELPPSTPVPAFDVWMRLTSSGVLGWVGPGVVDFEPYTGQPLHACEDSTSMSPGP